MRLTFWSPWESLAKFYAGVVATRPARIIERKIMNQPREHNEHLNDLEERVQALEVEVFGATAIRPIEPTLKNPIGELIYGAR